MKIDRGGLKMSELTWKYVKPLKSDGAVTDFLRAHNIFLPESLVACITKNNGGRPSEKLFDTDKGKEYVFKSLLSYNEGDLDCIHSFFPVLFEGTSLYPIGTDSSGNFICYDTAKGNYILLNHESNTRELISLH